jgi:nicotinic acid mononucleotide adenylyltransferase
MEMSDKWPMGKILSHLSMDGGGATDDRKWCVLVTTGAMNPLHNGHIRMIEKAKEKLSQEGYNVLGGFISPSHDLYVRPKCKRYRCIFLPAEIRCRIVDLACEDSDWISCGKWESWSKHCHWPDFPEVVHELRAFLTQTPGLEGVHVFYVCGEDHFRKCGLESGLMYSKREGVIMVRRGTVRGRKPCRTMDRPDLLVYVASSEPDAKTGDLSSTIIRQRLVQQKSICGMVNDRVEEYMMTTIHEFFPKQK